jgi:hypothetical protein
MIAFLSLSNPEVLMVTSGTTDLTTTTTTNFLLSACVYVFTDLTTSSDYIPTQHQGIYYKGEGNYSLLFIQLMHNYIALKMLKFTLKFT